MKKRLVIAITGASGAIYGVRMLEALAQLDEWESHLVMSASGALTAMHELDMGKARIEALADVVHSVKDIGASIASGSMRGSPPPGRPRSASAALPSAAAR